LRSDRVNEYFNSFGSGSSKIGSLGVCSINFPRLAIKYPNKEDFLEELKKMVEVSARVNNAKRKVVEKRIANGNEPLYTFGFMELSKQYSTTGVNGFNECIELLGEDILTQSGQELAIEILDTINNENDKHQKKYKAPFNVEQVPGENMSIKMADKDRLLKYQDKYNIYSNQFIPLTTNADIFDRIKLQGMFDAHFSGGAICHLNVDTKIEKAESMANLIKTAAKQGVVYFAINYVLSECEEGHMTVSNDEVCTVCGKGIENKYTRVVGFLTNVKNWHKKRREEDFPHRQFYKGV
jgi:ribonucleoside-triphosphate reductase